MTTPAIAPGQRSLDVALLADEVAFWSRMVMRDQRIGSAAKAEIAALFTAGLALARAAVLPKVGRADPGADERARRASIMGLGGLVR